MVGEEAKDVNAHCGRGEGAVIVMGPRRLCRFYREQEVEQAGRDEGYEEAAVVDYDVLQ